MAVCDRAFECPAAPTYTSLPIIQTLVTLARVMMSWRESWTKSVWKEGLLATGVTDMADQASEE